MGLPAMQYRTFGRTGLQVSLLGLGSGGPSQLGQSSGVPVEEAERLVRYALDRGINLIDTAADYHDSEAILGRALAGVPRERYVLCTKFSPVRNNVLKPPEALEASLRRSLERLGTEYVDVYQLHGVAPDWYRPVMERFFPLLQQAQERGQCRFLGITETFASDHEKGALRAALRDDVWDTMMVGYNLLTPTPEEQVLPAARRQDVGILVMCAVRRAIGRPERLEVLVRDLKARGKLASDVLPDENPLGWLARREVGTVTDAAYKYVAANPAVSCVLTGTANREHLDQNIAAVLGPPLPAADMERLRKLFGPVGENLGN